MPASRMYRIVTMCLLAGAFASVLVSAATAKQRTTTSPECRSSGIAEELELEPVELAGAPEPAALSRFGALRRPAGPADQLPPLNRIGSRLGLELASYYPAYIRQLVKVPNGSRYFLIPGLKRVPDLPPAQCLPKQLRHLRQPQPEPVYCVAGVGSDVRQLPRFGCQTLAEIETGGDLAEPYYSSSFQVDLVPDGVTTVRLVYRGGTVITAPVSENAFMFTPPRPPIARARAALKRLERTFELEGGHKSKHRRLTKRQRQRRARAAIKLLDRVLGELPPKQVQWLDAGGHVLRSFRPHRDRSGFLVITGGSLSSSNAVPIG
jgi:hypothetical protein